MRLSATRLLIFARAPVPGRAKTRLIPVLGAEGAARLHGRLVCRQVAVLAAVGLWPLELWIDGEPQHPLFRRLARSHPLTVQVQRGGDLGERMYLALRTALGRADSAVLMGSDCPLLDAALVIEAAERLGTHEAVLGPVQDGGYALLGVKRADPSLFAGVPWGTGRVASLTRERMHALGWRWHELPTLWDLDRPQDLERLQAAMPELLDGLAVVEG
jgi:rSAM/selenodomain-associated transferase 1